MKSKAPIETWQEMLSDEQRRLFNSACGDLSRGIIWHSFRLSKDDWRHMISGTVLGWRMMPGIDRGEGAAGLIMLGGSSLDLKKSDCTEAITLAFHIGDEPREQGLTCDRVEWGPVVKAARGIRDDDDDLAGCYA